MKCPLVSVIMPTYNSSEYLDTSVSSVLSQTYKNIELIIIDDCSSDTTQQLISTFQMDPRVNYIRLDQNLGVSEARNVGLAKAKGQYISFIDSDDFWMLDKLKCQIEFMEQKKIDFSYTYYDQVDKQQCFLKRIVKIPQTVEYKRLLKNNFIPLLTVILRRKALGKRRFKMIGHEDYLLWLEILRENKFKFELFPQVTAGYRVHKCSVSSNKLKSAFWVWKIYREFEKLGFWKASYNFLNYLILGTLKHF